jgi:GNAT superfamily N-acetyltransferase
VQIVKDRWLAERFGHPVFTVTTHGDFGDTAAVLEHVAGRESASYQARVPVESTEAAAVLTRAGFEVVNVAVTLSREPGPIGAADKGVEVRGADPGTDGVVLDIAERGLIRTRFHLDPSVPNAVAARVKRDWAEASLTGGRGDGMLVAVSDGKPVGFLAGLQTDDGGRRVRVIDLIAVAAPARGAGAGRALAARFVEDAQGSFEEVRVGTQAANPEAIRFYERLGFTTATTAYDLHLHVGDWRGAER